MRLVYTTLTMAIMLTAFHSMGQEKREVVELNRNVEPIRTELTNWDPIRGPWLASSLEAMASNEAIPTRNFPEKFTPYQMLSMVPMATRSNMMRVATTARTNGEDQAFWNDMSRYIGAPNCQSRTGRTYGDPHLISYDGARNSFQTVGEFVMTKSDNGDMEVQARQRPQGNDFSLNTAVAMNVSGNRVAIYAQDFPDGNYSTPVRVDGQPVQLNASTYFLPNGGTIKKGNNSYTVYWPSGESVTTEMRQSRNMDFMNITISVLDCSSGAYTGVLGNANGNRSDDFAGPGISPAPSFGGWSNDDDYFDRQRQAYMAKQFADVHRVTDATTLFDYKMGYNTHTFTDRTYPRVYRDLNDINRRQRDRSRRYCEQQGVNQRDMQGCIYDNAFLGIDASPAPLVPDPVQGTVLRPTNGNIENINRPPVGRPTPSVTNPRTEAPATRTDGSDSPGRETETRSEPTPRPEVTRPRTERPRPTPKPTPIPKPKPAPKPKPVPVPKPTPKTPVSPGGRGR